MRGKSGKGGWKRGERGRKKKGKIKIKIKIIKS
jgi:hypothetical protein